MINFQIVDPLALIAFWVTFTRWLAVMFQLPIFDNVSVPTLVKVLATLIISYAFYPYVSHEVLKDVQYLGANAFWILTIFNVIVGLTLGFFVKAIMSTFVSAGTVITQQIGFGMVRYFDPNTSQQVGPFEKLVRWTVLVMVISSGALIPMFKGVMETFHSIHIYDVAQLAQAPEFFVEMFRSIFISGLMLASPIIFTNILIMSILGIIARMVPQMNVLMVSFVVNIGLGLLVFATISNEFFTVAYRVYVEKLGVWFQFVT